MARWFSHFSSKAAALTGHWLTFIVALFLVILWAATGPFFKFSDTWQLIINTATTISTGLVVFLIQNTQNRDAMAIHMKLDELIRVNGAADNELMAAEDETEKELHELKRGYEELLKKHTSLKEKLGKETGVGTTS